MALLQQNNTSICIPFSSKDDSDSYNSYELFCRSEDNHNDGDHDGDSDGGRDSEDDIGDDIIIGI